MKTRSHMTLMLSFMVNAVIFGTGAVIVLSIESLRAYAPYLLPAVIVAALVATPVVSWWMAPRLRLQNNPD
jgi:hypothetical protein